MVNWTGKVNTDWGIDVSVSSSTILYRADKISSEICLLRKVD